MKNSILCLLFLITTSSQAQTENKEILNHKIGIGGLAGVGKESVIMGSYSLIKGRENEICFSVYYIDSKTAYNAIAGVGYYYSIFKKDSKFDLLVGGELNLNYRNRYDESDSRPRHGTWLTIGIIPVNNFSRRLSLSLETKLGYGYQWAKDYSFVFDYDAYSYSERGWYFMVLPLLKLNYRF